MTLMTKKNGKAIVGETATSEFGLQWEARNVIGFSLLKGLLQFTTRAMGRESLEVK